MRIPRTLSIFLIFFCIFNVVKRCIFVFCKFLDDVRFLENRNNIFEENSLKVFLRQSFRVVDFSNLSSDSRYLESVTLKHQNFSTHFGLSLSLECSSEISRQSVKSTYPLNSLKSRSIPLNIESEILACKDL